MTLSPNKRPTVIKRHSQSSYLRQNPCFYLTQTRPKLIIICQFISVLWNIEFVCMFMFTKYIIYIKDTVHASLLRSVWFFMDCSSPGSSVHGIFQAKILEWVAISPSRGSSWPRGGAHISCNSCTADGFFTTEPLESPQWASAVGKIPIFLSKVLHNDIYASKKIWYKDHPCNHYQFGLISYCYYY